MPQIPLSYYRTIPEGTTSGALLERGRRRMTLFCLMNKIPVPELTAEEDRAGWHVGACAYYRPQYIRICLPDCGRQAGNHDLRNWSYTGNVTDREPYGVVLHELGHHVDHLSSVKKGAYYGDYSLEMCRKTHEEPISSYHPNEAEWFAEMFRVFCTNPDLLRLLRPRTHEELMKKWLPTTDKSWVEELGPDCPDRIIKSLEKKIRGRK